jgi:hypothetical protein
VTPHVWADAPNEKHAASEPAAQAISFFILII